MEIIGFNIFGGIDVKIDGIITHVPDDMGNAHRIMIAEWESEGGVIPKFIKIEIKKTKLYKSTFIRRLSFSEATTLDGILNEQEAYLKLLYNSVEWFEMSDGFVTYLDMILTEVFGKDRALTLLEPEE